MLQQTQVVTVIPYFNRFVNNLPSIKFLANVKKKINQTLEGLGYYSRARNLKRTAQIIIKNFNGKLPDNFEDLITLPGIEIILQMQLAIVFNKPYIPLDGNMKEF